MTHRSSNGHNVSLLVTIRLRYHAFFAPDFSGILCRQQSDDLPEGSGNNLKKKILEKGAVFSQDT
jgi:hypothetical protein